MAHLYWSIVCKTEDCKFRHLVSYMGENMSGETFIARPASIHFRCFECEKEYDYSEDELKMFPSASPPPVGWKSVF
jgi:hypothetical protein